MPARFQIKQAKNHQIIGNCERYIGQSGMKEGIKSVSKNAPNAKIEDIVVTSSTDGPTLYSHHATNE